MTELKDKAIDIKWKKYVLVSDRVLYFNENYPNGCIQTVRETVGDKEIIKAVVCPDCDKLNRVFTWYSQATWGDGFINKTSALENAETSAVGRALGFAGFGIDTSIASAEEVQNAIIKQDSKNGTTPYNFQEELMIQESQKQQIRTEIDEATIKNYLKEKGKSKLSELTFKEAYDLLKKDDKEKEEVF